MRNSVRLAVTIIVFGAIGFACMRIATAGPDLPADPLTAPAASFDDFKALYKIGWPITVLAAVNVLARLLGKLGGRFRVLGEGKVAAVIAAVSALSASAFDVLALGGSWGSVVAAVAMGALALWDAASKPKADAIGQAS